MPKVGRQSLLIHVFMRVCSRVHMVRGQWLFFSLACALAIVIFMILPYHESRKISCVKRKFSHERQAIPARKEPILNRAASEYCREKAPPQHLLTVLAMKSN